MSVFSVEKKRSNVCEGKKLLLAMSIQTSIMVGRDKEAFSIKGKRQKAQRIFECPNVVL
jgi:hypothetical protein